MSTTWDTAPAQRLSDARPAFESASSTGKPSKSTGRQTTSAGLNQTSIPELRRALAEAAAGAGVDVGVEPLRSLGDRSSWYGTATVRGGKVLSSATAHAVALASVITDDPDGTRKFRPSRFS